MKFSFTLLSAVVSLGGALASNVIDLTPDNFHEIIGKGKPALVEFFAPWCGHCKNLAPTYEQLADAFAHAKDKVIIAKVDADGEGKPLGKEYGVTGFPTLKWFNAAGEPEKYEGGRDLDALAGFVTKSSGVKSNIKPPPPPAFKVLDTHNFDEVALDSSKDVLVTFTAPWCGHCKRMKPFYEEAAKIFAPESKCVLANVDADDIKNRPLAEKYGIGSFPTIYFFGKDSKVEPELYEGERTTEAFVEYLNTKCGTQRSPKGGLSDAAGRIPELDTLAEKFFDAAGHARQEIFNDAAKIAETVGPAAKHYIKVMEKVVNGSEEYLEKESKRLASILSKRTLSSAKLDEIKIKANILSAFRAVEAKVEEVIGRETAEL
ncbi:protein disulfide isomerase [Cristinia sonorae]|uniref:protein disulfide-isomerase n=1 Tax=Cristinia sonorae TaxID=1940300 RepID=A0A8K0UET3_9AGAR|nr:protein disulfide isomerase [Cristinia sonorae]